MEFVSGVSLTHLVKYLVVIIIHLCLLEEGGLIAPINSNPTDKKIRCG